MLVGMLVVGINRHERRRQGQARAGTLLQHGGALHEDVGQERGGGGGVVVDRFVDEGPGEGRGREVGGGAGFGA